MAFCRCRAPLLSQRNLSHRDSDWRQSCPIFDTAICQKKWDMWPKSARLQYAYKVQVSDCKWFCSGPMNDVHCIRHSVTVMCLGRDQFVRSPARLRHEQCFSSLKFAFPRAAGHRKRIPKRAGSPEENIFTSQKKKTKTAEKEARFYIHGGETGFIHVAMLRKH